VSAFQSGDESRRIDPSTAARIDDLARADDADGSTDEIESL
jgi:hypothetical protein